MTGVQRSAFGARQTITSMVLAALALLVLRFPVRAAPPVPAAALQTRKQLLHTLRDVRNKYGADAVFMEGQLLAEAIRNGSVLTASVRVSGMEDRGGKRFLGFKLDTGIVYNDRELTSAARWARAWSDVIEGTLRTLRSVAVPADGVAIVLRYTHKAYADEADLRAHLGEGPGESEAAAFYLLARDVSELIAGHITARQLLERSAVSVNGVETSITRAPPAPSR
ncbi:MAG: hypothetical protein ACE5I7_15550 [Candidatus Binatia bacterium]